mgnify:CR=1 FL=1
MDCTFLIDEGKFNIRVCALVLHAGRLLLGRCEGDPYWHTVGGRLKTGETLKIGVKRECREETGVSLRAERLAVLSENFFTLHGTAFHELAFYYWMETPPDPAAIPSEFCEDGVREELRWSPLKALPQAPVLPPFLQSLNWTDTDWPLHVVLRQEEGTTICEPLR